MAEVVVVSEPAPAKLNLYLRVLGRRGDGFHDVETLVLPVTLVDGVRAETASEISLTVVGPGAREVPEGEGNLVVRAAQALRKACGAEGGARLFLAKQIPVAAGLGGGSADAAATLRALNDVWGCRMDVDDLMSVAAEVGSDVPALVWGRPVVARGRGEIVDPIDVPRTWWVILPASGVASGEAYEWWDEDGREPGPDPGPLIEVLRAGDLDAVAGYLFNDLEDPVASRRPEVRASRERLLEAGAIGTVMCGSGPSLAGLARDGRHAEQIARSCRGVIVSSVNAEGSGARI